MAPLGVQSLDNQLCITYSFLGKYYHSTPMSGRDFLLFLHFKITGHVSPFKTSLVYANHLLTFNFVFLRIGPKSQLKSCVILIFHAFN